MNTEENFLPFAESKMLKELNYDKGGIAYFDNKNVLRSAIGFRGGALRADELVAPLYQEVEAWLWERYKFVVCVDICHDHACTYVIREKGAGIIIPEVVETEDDFFRCDSPITAKNEGIKQVIRKLHKELKQKK